MTPPTETSGERIFWYTWLGAEPGSDPFDYAGLLALTPGGRVRPKPALRSYELTLARLER